VIHVAEEVPTVSTRVPNFTPATPVLPSPKRLEPEIIRTLVV
jgi:hypothetical protein